MSKITLQQFLAGLKTRTAHRAALAKTIAGLAAAAAELAGAIADGSRNACFAEEGEINVQGETQKQLDVLAHRLFLQAAKQAGVHCLLSEEEDEAVPIDPAGVLALAIDPLDGSSNIVINAPIGTIFGIYPVALGGISSQFLRPGKELLAAAYVVYGPRTEIVLSIGVDTKRFVLTGDRTDWLFAGNCVIPKSASEFAINASNHRHWSKEVRSFVNFCVEGRHGPYAEDYNMRWLAALVGETHRILTRGGLFLYPADKRKGYENGRLRYCYECAPISFLVENAGGLATDGAHRILDMTPSTLHERVPFCFGSPQQMANFSTSTTLMPDDSSPLFSDRGFFRKGG